MNIRGAHVPARKAAPCRSPHLKLQRQVTQKPTLSTMWVTGGKDQVVGYRLGGTVRPQTTRIRAPLGVGHRDYKDV